MHNSTRLVDPAQRNVGEHCLTIRRLADRYRPDIVFPLMDLSVEAARGYGAAGRVAEWPVRCT